VRYATQVLAREPDAGAGVGLAIAEVIQALEEDLEAEA
jgi:hypothetical protein